MNESVLDWLETDDFDTYGESMDGEFGDSPYEGEDLDSEFYGESDSAESRASRRRARGRQVAMARRRRRQAQLARNRMNARGRALADGRRPAGATPERREIQKAQEGIEKVELENQVQGDIFSRALNVHQRRLGRSEQAFALNKVLDELKVRLPDLFQDDAIRTAVGLTPLLVLAPERKGKGVEDLLADPRVWSTILIGGIALFAKTQTQTVVKIRPESATIGAGSFETVLSAFVADKNGQPVRTQPAITWTSLSPAVASVDSTGRVTRAAGGSGTAIISAAADKAQAGVATVVVEPTSIP